jgi:plasmid maintenance system antidote protein VapI
MQGSRSEIQRVGLKQTGISDTIIGMSDPKSVLQTPVLRLRDFLASRDITQDAAGLLAGVDGSTISRICAGQVQARPATVVKLAKALGVSASRMQRMCEAHWLEAHPEERVSA